MRILLTFSILLLFNSFLNAQRVLGKPEVYDLPMDKKYTEAELRDRKSDEGWFVVVDRSGVVAYEKNSELSTVKTPNLKYLESFYVKEESGEWVYLVDATVDGRRINRVKRDIGWVKRDNLLLWKSGLIDPRTHIHKKVLLVNKAEQLKDLCAIQDVSLVEIYDSPIRGNRLEDRKIYNFFFVLKKEGHRLLLCMEDKFSQYDLSNGSETNTKIVGWVDQDKCSFWNTRIALEPNFKKEAFKERRDNTNLQILGYDDFELASQHGNAGKSPEPATSRHIVWDNDPVTLEASKLSPNNPYRYRGTVMRFPMLSSGSGDKLNKFTSSVISDVKIVKYVNGVCKVSTMKSDYDSGIRTIVQNKMAKNRAFNIFFVVEGSEQMFPYQALVADAMENVKRSFNFESLRFGAAIYRGVEDENVAGENRMLEVFPLNQDEGKVIDFVRNAKFNNWNDRSGYTCMYYALQQSMQKAGFREGETNIVILLGVNADYRADSEIKKAKEGHKTYVDKLDLASSLSKLDVHLYGIQPQLPDENRAIQYAVQVRSILLNSATMTYNKGYGAAKDPKAVAILNGLRQDGINVGEPKIADIPDNDPADLPVENSVVPGRVLLPSSGSEFKPESLTQMMERDVKESDIFVRRLNKFISDVYMSGNDAKEAIQNIDKGDFDKVSAGRFPAAYADLLNEMLPDIPLDPTIASKEEKYSLQTETFFPRKIDGATSSAFSFVLFMPESDLKDYIKTINRYINQSGGTCDKKREALAECYKQILVQFTGNPNLGDVTRKQILEYMQGVYGEGLDIEVDLNYKISQILDERAVTCDEVDLLLRRFSDVVNNLQGVIKKGDQYPFSYKSDVSTYYWIPVEDVF